jgi:hypothetical protein
MDFYEGGKKENTSLKNHTNLSKELFVQVAIQML